MQSASICAAHTHIYFLMKNFQRAYMKKKKYSRRCPETCFLCLNELNYGELSCGLYRVWNHSPFHALCVLYTFFKSILILKNVFLSFLISLSFFHVHCFINFFFQLFSHDFSFISAVHLSACVWKRFIYSFKSMLIPQVFCVWIVIK